MSEPTGPQETTKAKAPRWMRIALVASLGLNLLTVGAIVSAAWHMRHGPGPGGPGMQARLNAFVDKLPAERAAAIRAVLDSAQPAIRSARKEMWQARQEVARVFAAEPFDKDAYVAAHARMQDLEMKIRQTYQGVFASLASQLTAEERKTLMEHRWGRWRGGPPPGVEGPDGNRAK
jgi:uncharacterized membrane protein